VNRIFGRRCRWRRSHGRWRGTTTILGFALQVAHMAFEGAFEFAGHSTEFGHELAEVPRKIG
jgi:hypothetical protein